MQLAEFNLSVWKIDDTSEAARGFVDKVGQVNARADGFVWRLHESRDEHGRTPFGGPETLVTLSVSRSTLEQFSGRRFTSASLIARVSGSRSWIVTTWFCGGCRMVTGRLTKLGSASTTAAHGELCLWLAQACAAAE
jgi:hypothetical protein